MIMPDCPVERGGSPLLIFVHKAVAPQGLPIFMPEHT